MKIRPLLGILAVSLIAAGSHGQTVSTVTTNGLFEPYGVAVDLSTNLYYFTDSAHYRIVRFNPANGEFFTFSSFIFGTNGFTGFPQGIVVARGGLAVADSANHAVYQVNTNGDVSLIAGGTRGSADGVGSAAQFDSPSGLAIDSSGNIYVADLKNSLVRRIAPDNRVTTYASGFNKPDGVAVGENGRVYVADTLNNVIKVIETNLTVSVIAGRIGIEGTDDGSGSLATFDQPRGLVWIGGETGLLVSDSGNDTIRRVFFKGGSWRVETYAGVPEKPGLVNGDAKIAQFSSPIGLARDVLGSIIVADLYNMALRRIERAPSSLPVVNLAGGSFSNAVSITVTSATPNTVIRYTTDGTDPTDLSPAVSGPVSLSAGPVTFKVRGFSPDFATSAVVSNNFSFFVNPLSISVPGGTFTNEIDVAISTLTTGKTLRFTTNGIPPTTNSSIWVDGPYSVNGTLLVQGFRDGFTPSAVLSNNFTFIVATPEISPAGATATNSVLVTLASATRPVDLFWTIDGSEPARTNGTRYIGPFALGTNGTLKVKGFRDGFVESQTATNVFNLSVANPVISPASATAINAVIVRITSDTDPVELYWTINGSQPSRTNGFLYTGPFSLGTNGTLRVKGFRAGFTDSATINGEFSFTVATPTSSPAGTNSNNGVSVILRSDTSPVSLYFTIDGTEPSPTNGTLYSGPFVLATNGTLRAKGFRDGFNPSLVGSWGFDLSVARPVISPAGATTNNPVSVTLTSATQPAELFWTIDGSEPSRTNGTLYTGSPFLLGTNGTLRVKGLRNGFTESPVASAEFDLSVANPVISPAGAATNNSVTVTLTTATTSASLYWSIDGSEPTTNSVFYAGPFVLATNGTLQVRGFKNGFVSSQIVSNVFNLRVAAPSISPASSTNINSVLITLASDTANAAIHYTVNSLDEPGTNSPLYTVPFNITNTSLVKAGAFRNGFLTSAVVSNAYWIQVDTPRISAAGELAPGAGFFPNGTTVTLSVQRADARIYYTVNGQDPTTNSTLYTGPFKFDQVSTPGADLRVLKARAFAPNTLPSEIASGQAVQTNQIGVPLDVFAGIGATVVIPVVVNLSTNDTLKSLEFRIQISPNSPAAPVITNELRALPIGSNDFIQVVGPAVPGSVINFSTTSYRLGVTNGLAVTAIGTNANLSIQNFAAVVLLAVTIPSNATTNDSYKIEIVQPSGTSDGQQKKVTLTPLPTRIITVRNIPYIVGDSAIGSWYNAGDFGDGNLNNSDVNNAFYASLGVRMPFPFTDVFDAMDAFPEDTAGVVGGDGQIRFLDWQRILRRSLRLDANNHIRSWSAGGVRVASPATLSGSPNTPAKSFTLAGSSGSVWSRQAVISGTTLENVIQGETVSVPVYVKTSPGSRLSGLAFRVTIAADGEMPAVSAGVEFQAAPGVHPPIQVPGPAANVLLCGWNLGDFSPALENSNLLGYVRFTVPSAAPSGQSYTIRFSHADGSPDISTQYDLETIPISVWVNSSALKPAERISDEWRVNFFGDFASTEGFADADPDGDGLTNLAEYLSGTNPGAADWRFRRTADGFTIRWFGQVGKRYQIERSVDLTHWEAAGSLREGGDQLQEFSETDLTWPVRFYRVRVQ